MLKPIHVIALALILFLFVTVPKTAERIRDYNEFEYHIELLNQKQAKVYNNSTSVIVEIDSLPQYFEQDNQ